jgi:predicted tellurium resistance membrane protein TerC
MNHEEKKARVYGILAATVRRYGLRVVVDAFTDLLAQLCMFSTDDGTEPEIERRRRLQ